MPELLDRIVLQYRDVLRETERFSGDEMRNYQEQLLEPLIRHANEHVPFYNKRLASLVKRGVVDLSRWRDIPILTRAQAQRHSKALQAKYVPPLAGKVAEEVTSGSTGRPLRHLVNELLTMATLSLTDRVYRWWDFDGEQAMATFTSRRRELAPPPHGITSRQWRSGYPGGVNHIIDMWADTQVQIDWLLEREPAYLAAYSSTLPPLADAVKQRGCGLRFEKILSAATMVTDDIREICEQVFGAPVIDQYGAQEVGHIAAQCASCGLYHVSSENVLLEILDDDGAPCRPGETGRVVVTSLYNYAMPFIRYEIGDFATLGPAAAECHIKLPTLSRIAGRYRDTFTLADGRIIYPYVAIERFRDFIPFRQVQVVQTDYDRLEVGYVEEDVSGDTDEKGLEAYLREAIDPDLSVHIVKVDEIARDASGKFVDFKSKVPRR